MSRSKLIALTLFGLVACKPEALVPADPVEDRATQIVDQRPIAVERPLIPDRLIASAELRAIEATQQMTGIASFYGTAAQPVLHLKVAGLAVGKYAVYLGRDCRPAAQPVDPVPSDKKGLGSAPALSEELRISALTIDNDGETEISVPVPEDRPGDPPLAERTVIIMPQDAEDHGRPRTRSACGEISPARSGS
jgi:hypothetical protein